MSLMHYDMEADWILLQTCNYRCAYCFAPPELLGEKLQPVATPAEWRSALDRTGHTWLLHLTGGEPSIYPKFVDLCEILTERHFMSFNSNLTNASIAEFAARIDPARVSFINAGFHLEERERRSGHAVFLRHAATLQDAGFAVLVSIVATPSVLERYDDAVSILAPLGIVPIPKLFRGVENGKTYPQDYTALDRTRFSQAASHARASYASRLAQMSERPTIDIFRDDAFLSGEPVFTGEMCDAGSKLVRIAPNGDVSRCGPPNLGNLLAGTFKPMRRAAPCDTKFCYYFCEKYTATARVSATTAVRRSGFVGRFFSVGIGAVMPGSLLRKSRPREPLHIAILSFNRPRYLQQVLKSLRRQVSEQDEIVLMQDGAVNAWSGRVKSSAADVQACVSLFRRMIPWGKIFESPTNISIALNYERAEKYLFETKQRPHACILEDDLVLSPRYLEVLTALLSIAKADPRIAYVSACGNMWAQLDEQRRCAAELSHMHENWGFAMTREAWLDERPFRAKYLRLLEDRDYSQRDHAGIAAFYRMRGWTTQITSQDAARWIACIELGKVRLTTFACHARNIGRTGEHFTPEIYDRGGFGGTVMYLATLPRLSPPTAAQIDQWLDVERKRFSDVTRGAFYEGHGVRMA